MNHLLDVNVLIALAAPEHIHHKPVMKWFNTPRLQWALCAFTEAGFLRVATNPNASGRSFEDSTQFLQGLAEHPGYHYFPIKTSWPKLTEPLQDRIFGHQQITDAMLLGLAIQEKAVLVTLDKAIPFLAGPKFNKHILLLG